MQYDTIQQDDPVFHDPNIQGLIKSINDSSAGASSGWVLFISGMTYFFVALSGVSHEDFLLNSAVNQPILQVELDLRLFFYYAPLVLVFLHFGILIQHEALADKLRAFDQATLAFEGPEHYRMHPIRRQLSGYFFTQVIAGPRRSKLLQALLNLMGWVTLFLLPVLTLIAFQITFLPYHDAWGTFWHKVYLVADVVMYLAIVVFYSSLRNGVPVRRGFGTAWQQTGRLFFNYLIAASAVFFSVFIATIPDSATDVVMRNIWPEPVPYGWKPEEKGDKPARYSFWPTAYLFEGPVNEWNSEPRSLFARNLVLVDRDLVKDKDWNPQETTLLLRARNLSYATFDRTDLRGTDFSNAKLNGARFHETNLHSAKFHKANLASADMRGARFAGNMNMTEADLRYANLNGAKLQGRLGEDADDEKIDLTGAKLQNADLRGALFINVDMRRANLTNADLSDAMIYGMTLNYADLSGANLQRLSGREGGSAGINAEGANLQNAQLDGANIKGRFQGADLEGADLPGARLSLRMEGANLRRANLLGAHLENANLSGAILAEANLQGALLNGAKLFGVDLRKAELYGAEMRGAEIWSAKAPLPEQLDLIDLRDLKLESPSEKDIGSIWESIEDDELRLTLQNRITAIIGAGANWNRTEDYAIWNELKARRPDVSKMTEFVGQLICSDATPEGYIANTQAYEVTSNANLRSHSIDDEDDPDQVISKDMEKLWAIISDKQCEGAKLLPAHTRSYVKTQALVHQKERSRHKAWLEKQSQTGSQQN